MQRKPGTLVNSPNRMLAMQQTGLQALDSQMSSCQSQAQPHGGCPKGLAAICIPTHNLGHVSGPPGNPAKQCLCSGSRDTVAVLHTGPFVQKCGVHEQRQLPWALSSKPRKKGFAVKLPDRSALRVEGPLAES